MEAKKKYLAITYEGMGSSVQSYEGWRFWGCSMPATIALALLAGGIILMSVKLSRIEKKIEELKKA